MGDINRQTGIMKNSDRNSKAHIILRLTIESFTYLEASNKHSKVPQCIINFVDLGGSESLSDQLVDRQSKKEKTFQIKSIQTLDTIISLLSEGNQPYVPYRESKLTRFLMPYLEGDSEMLWFFNISPIDTLYNLNCHTLDFAMKVSLINQKVEKHLIHLEETSLFEIKKKIALLKLRISKLEL